jgi:hypothetical protein
MPDELDPTAGPWDEKKRMSRLARARLLHGKLHRPRRVSLPETGRSDAGDSCGCAMGAKFLAAGLILSILWYAWPGHASSLSVGGIVLRIFLWCFLAAGAGKLVGLAGYSLRQQRLRLRKSM